MSVRAPDRRTYGLIHRTSSKTSRIAQRGIECISRSFLAAYRDIMLHPVYINSEQIRPSKKLDIPKSERENFYTLHLKQFSAEGTTLFFH